MNRQQWLSSLKLSLSPPSLPKTIFLCPPAATPSLRSSDNQLHFHHMIDTKNVALLRNQEWFNVCILDDSAHLTWMQMASTTALAQPKGESAWHLKLPAKRHLGSPPICLMCWPVKRITAIVYCSLLHPANQFFHGGSSRCSWPSYRLQMVLW